MTLTIALDQVETPQLQLSRPRLHDALELRSMHQDPRVMATLGGNVWPDDKCDAWLTDLAAHWDRHGFGWWIARGRSHGDFVGRGGLRCLTLDGESVIELGYAIRSELWGRGLASELADAALRVAFDALHADAVVAWTLPTNLASQRVMRNAGLSFARDMDWAGRRHVLYRITADDWLRRHDPAAP